MGTRERRKRATKNENNQSKPILKRMVKYRNAQAFLRLILKVMLLPI